MSEQTKDVTTDAPAREDDALELSHPDALFSGKPFPTFDHVFHTSEGKRIKVRMRGLSYARKSEIDALFNASKAEDEAKGIFKPDMRAPRLLARAMCTPDGKFAYVREEDEIVKAMSLMEQLGDGEIGRAYNRLMEKSGYGKDVMADAEKS